MSVASRINAVVGQHVHVERRAGVVVAFTPLSAALTDVLVRFDDGGGECWFSSYVVRFADGTPLPLRQDLAHQSDCEVREFLTRERARLEREIRADPRAPKHMAFMQALHGRGIDAAIGEIDARIDAHTARRRR